MYLTRRTKIQLAIFALIALAASSVMIFGYMKLPTLWFNTGHYNVEVQLPRAAGLYEGDRKSVV